MTIITGIDIGLQNMAICQVQKLARHGEVQILTWTLAPVISISKKTKFVERLIENVRFMFDQLLEKYPMLIESDVIMIELQMKTNHLCTNLSNAVETYFLDKAITSKKALIVNFVNPKHKLQGITIKDNTNKSRYENVKETAVVLVNHLIKTIHWNGFLQSQTKMDDLADAYLTALVYFQVHCENIQLRCAGAQVNQTK